MAFSFKNIFNSLQSKTTLATSAVGIDIGRSSIKVVELERSERGPVLKTYGEIQLGPYQKKPVGATIDPSVEELQTAIIDVFREAGVTANSGVLALPLSTGFVTIIEIPVREGEDLESRIPVEARKYVPLPLQEITLDWAPVGMSTANDSNEQLQTILLVALQNEVVVSYRSLLSQLKLAQQPMELAMFSAARAMNAYQKDHVALLDLGASVTKLYIYQRGTLAAIHRFTASGEAVTEKIATMRSIDFAQAELLKRADTKEADVARDVKTATSAVYDTVLREVARALTAYESKHNVSLETLYVSGGVVTGEGVRNFIADSLQRNTALVFPFEQVAYPAFMEDVLRAIGPSFTNSVGSALRQLQE